MNDKKNPPETDKQPAAETRQMITVPIEYLPLCNPEEDEIDLRELLAVLMKRKWLIAATTILVIGLGFLYAFVLAKPVYEAKATIEIGHHLASNKNATPAPVYFCDRDRLKQYLDTKYDTAGKYRPKETAAYVSKVTIPKKTRGFLTIAALGPDNRQAIEALDKPLEEITSRHLAFYNAVLKRKQDRVKQLETRIANAREITLPQLQTELKMLQTVQLKKIDDRIRLAKTIDIKKIDDRITFLKKREVPILAKKIAECENEIEKKIDAVEKMRLELDRLIQKDAAMATLTAMQVANLQNDISSLRVRIIDFQAKIKKIEEETIRNDLEKRKTRILEKTIPDLEAEKRKLLEERVPRKKAEIKKLLNDTIPEMETQIEQIRTEMKPPYLTRAEVIGGIRTHDHPVKPRKKLVVALAGILGLMLGVFLAFSREFFAKQS